jgi:Fe-S cluster biosynthesis and repair protein YggX
MPFEEKVGKVSLGRTNENIETQIVEVAGILGKRIYANIVRDDHDGWVEYCTIASDHCRT